ncbi:MAG: hypothetical protein C5B45_06295 [Chlamydiae bacterium]|nr:MAG: hypothetical protein C5B45_06295 [Chlamydiota bacterium]
MINNYFYQKTIETAFVLIGSSGFTPCPLHQAITCHLLQYLIDKVQKRAFIYLFPTHYNESLYQRNLVQYDAIIADRGRDEHRNKYFARCKFLNKAIASAITLLLLTPCKWNALYKLIIIHYLFTVRLFAMQTALKILIFMLQKIHQSVKHLQQIIPAFFISNLIPQRNDLVQKNGETIQGLLAELREKFPNVLEDLEQSTDLLDWVTCEIPIYPVKEKGTPQHFWDVETIKIFFTNSSTPDCPNGCRIKLELEDAVDTNLQINIIELLEKAYNAANNG